jgi:hypothetical protein
MRKLLTLTLGPALPALLAAAVLAGCGGSDNSGADTASAERSTTSSTAHRSTTTSETTEAPTTTEAPAPSTTMSPTTTGAPTTTSPTTTGAPTTTSPPAATGTRYVCPEGGIDAVRALQRSVDAGHQPWRLSATDVAAGCTYGVGTATVEPAGTKRYLVTNPSTGEQVLVTLAQPLGPGTIWAVTSITPA